MKTLYMCELCRTRYEVAADALACEAQGYPTGIKVGDVITKHDGYGWYNGDSAWVLTKIAPESTAHLVKTINDFYWLVIDIKPGANLGNKHANEVLCVTRGVVNGLSVDDEEDWGVSRFYHYCDTRMNDINPVVATDVPPKVREEAAAFMARGYVIETTAQGNLAVSKKKEA